MVLVPVCPALRACLATSYMLFFVTSSSHLDCTVRWPGGAVQVLHAQVSPETAYIRTSGVHPVFRILLKLLGYTRCVQGLEPLLQNVSYLFPIASALVL